MIIFGALITGVSIVLFFVLGALILSRTNNFNLTFGEFILFWISLILFAWGLSLMLSSLEDIRYKEGQIDCLNGVIKYEEVTRESTTWEPIKEDNQ